MAPPSPLRTGGVALVVSALLVLSAMTGVAAAETRSGGTVVVAEGETVDGLTAFGGTIVVRGTVEGDLEAFAGNVFVEGEVTGDVSAFAGNVRISGTVGGDVEASAGNVFVAPGAEIGGNLEAGGGNVVIGGTVGGNVQAAGGTVTLARSASIGGNVEYAVGEDGRFSDEGATVGGEITRNADLQVGSTRFPSAPPWVFDAYGLLANLALGAVLLLVFPDLSRRVADRVAADPLRTGGIGLLALIGVPVALLVVALTVIGIPLSIVGALLFALLLWVAVVYGRFALGMWLVSLADADDRWLGLVVGTVAVAAVKLVPVLGGLVEFAVLLLGLGALAALGSEAYRRRRGTASEDAGPAVEGSEPSGPAAT